MFVLLTGKGFVSRRKGMRIDANLQSIKEM